MPEALYTVTLSTASHAGTIVLEFYVNVFISSLNIIGIDW